MRRSEFDCVSIHARHFWRAKHTTRFGRYPHRSFQSTPVISGGRNAGRPSQRWQNIGFNPRPSFLAGETGGRNVSTWTLTVSIHARHFWRAKRARLGCAGLVSRVSIHARHFWRAKPSQRAEITRRLAVSIHARHFWRAKRGLFRLTLARWRFNPRPSFLAGETSLSGIEHGASWFQSTPVISGGRNGSRASRCHAKLFLAIPANHWWRWVRQR